ncbi:monocarboxylate transporter 14-like isoform X1 [Haliotis rufescens]|uniref:monocarboxylate transporter 14-like isoform X1 n=1 Tax=Haliotis rufescens TaxID=6454 RepID=UPI00201F513A|nr:monocarboxylate transporter 14-like isoform X1 [Haliotis rufescens]
MKEISKELTTDLNLEEVTPLDYSGDDVTSIQITNGVEIACEDVGTPSPSDGGWGWICVGARFVAVFITFGIVYSFGVIYVELVDVFNATRAEVAWVGSVASGAMHMAGPLSSLLIEQYGCRVTTIVAGVVAALGFFVSSFAPSLAFLYFSFGMVGGLGLGLSIVPSVVAVTVYFRKRRSLAISISAIGAGVGTMCLPQLYRALINQYGWRGIMMVLSGVALNLVVCGSLFRMPPHTIAQQRKRTHLKRRPPRCVSFQSLFVVLNHRPFLIFLTATAFTHLGVMVPYVHLPDLARLTGVAKGDASFLVSIMGLVGILGRLVFGYVADFSCLNRIFFYAVMLLICGAATFLCTMVKTYALFAVYAAVQGAFIGTWTAFTSIVVTDIVGVDHTGNALGLTIFLSGISVIVASPIAGSLFDLTGRYVASFYLAASIYLLGGSLNMAGYLYIKLKQDKGIID